MTAAGWVSALLAAGMGASAFVAYWMGWSAGRRSVNQVH
jgi:hypothetical protein